MRMNEYLQTLTEQIRCKKAHPMIEEEYRMHIQDQADEYVRCGMEEMEAEEAAVAQMGDPVEAGAALDRIHRPKLCVSVIVTILFLTATGIVMQAILFQSFDNSWVQERYLGRSIAYNLLGFGVMALICYLDYSLLYRHALKLCTDWFALWLVLDVWCTPGISGFPVFLPLPRVAAGTAPYYLQALFYPLYAACLFRLRGQGRAGFAKVTALALPAFLLTAAIPGTAKRIEFFVVMLVLLSAAFLKGWYGQRGVLKTVLMWCAAIAVPAVYLARYLAPSAANTYQAHRLRAFLNGYAGEEGYVTIQIRDVLSHIRPGGAAQVIEGELSNVHNDFILLSIFVYFGMIVGVLVCAAFVFFFVRILRISLKQKNQLAFIVGLACTLTLFLRGGLYALVNFGILPYTQMNLPFMSYGLLAALSNAVLVGLLLSIHRYEDVIDEKQFAAKRRRFRIRLEAVDEVKGSPS